MLINIRLLKFALLLAIASVGQRFVFAEGDQVVYHGAGWMTIGKVQKAFLDTNNISNSYQNNWMQNSGGQFSASMKLDDNWDGGFGLGTILVHLARGAQNNASQWYPFWVPFVPEARLTYNSKLFTQDDKFTLNLGAFPYDYNPDVKDLGLYLLKGYVYPGNLVSGFGNVVGGMASYQIGGFRDDLILNSETEDKPLYDFSVADVVSYKIMDGIEVGAGVNLYRFLPASAKVTSPGKDCVPSRDLGGAAGSGLQNACYILDTNSTTNVIDTITGSLAGTKLMARFHFDPKAVFGFSGPLGKSDLILYGEAAILGLKDYPVFYQSMKRRIPVMLGFNVPAFGLVDNFSVEMEYYGSRNNSDNLEPENGSWVPVVNGAVSTTRDNWKWAFVTSKVFLEHLKFSGQVANDHLRLGGSHNVLTGVEVTSTPSDWYWTCALAYFF